MCLIYVINNILPVRKNVKIDFKFDSNTVLNIPAGTIGYVLISF